MASKYAELVEAEAGQVAESGDEPTGDEPGEPTDDPTEPDNEAAAEDDEATQAESAQALVKKLDSENTRHAKTLARLMEVDVASLEECPQCASYGFLPPGQTATPEFLQDPQAARCDQCGGRGMTKTGALPPGEETYNCSKCGGRGWVTVTPMPQVPEYHQTQDNGAVAPVAPPGYILVATGV